MSQIWQIEDELLLLTGVIDFGLNWNRISKLFNNREPEECECYYLDRFIDSPFDESLKQILKDHCRKNGLCGDYCGVKLPFDETLKIHSVASVIEDEKFINNLSPYNKHISNIINVTSVEDSVNNFTDFLQRRRSLSVSHVLLPGYNPNRSDFEIECDDKAESILALMHEPNPDETKFPNKEDQDFLDDLKVALVNAYNFRLSERIRKKKIIRIHALLDRRKTYSVLQRYESVCGKHQLLSLLSCMRFLSGPEIDFLLEQLKLQKDLKIKINKLSGYRRLGLKYLDTVDTYEKLYTKRFKHKHELEVNLMSLDFKVRFQKRPTAPLVLHNLPGYTELEDEEKDLCSTSRIVPETYLGFKKLMIQECQRLNGLKLAQARPLFKIDVNKTRKMYDYLISKHLIWLPVKESS